MRWLKNLCLVGVGVALSLTFPIKAHRKHETPRCDFRVTANSGTKRVAKMVRCAARVTPGISPQKAIEVASCESGLNPRAISPGGHLGIFQHIGSRWADRAARYGFRGHAWTDPRAQAFVTARMVRDAGWSAWSCA